MPTWLKVVLIVILVMAVLLGVGVYFGIRWLKAQGGALQEEGQEIVAEAKRFGEGKDAKACVDETFVRLRACDGFICEAKVRVFLSSCLDTANVSPEFCRGVPRTDEIMKSVRWILDECARQGMANEKPCTRVIKGVQERCEGARL